MEEPLKVISAYLRKGKHAHVIARNLYSKYNTCSSEQ